MQITHIYRKTGICILLFAIVAAFDYLTGYEVSSYPAYLMPIFLAFFNFGKIGGYVACGVAIVLWMVIDVLNGHFYSHEALRYWNGGSRFLVYLMFVYGLSIYAKTVTVNRERLQRLRQLMPMCHGCGRVFWKDGSWKTPAEALELATADVPECPGCAATGAAQPHSHH